ncbi:MAG: excinuclease ABC subunit UvrA [Verrucomicrobia bacterium]|nr:excinuclease ABC subunit UvrA [Verrucomicrobiota bacterium]
MAKEFIRVVGARQHNLKNLTVEIPRDRLVVITGPSGSGKSSLAFDTLFAEGQRKYVESLSIYARQFLDQLEKPEVEHIEGLSPAIAIEQRSSAANPRSTIATTTEIYDYLRLLFANVGQPHDPETGAPMTRRTTTEIADTLLALPTQSRLMLLAPMVEDQKGEFRDVLERLAREGFVRARVDGQMIELIANKPVRLDPQAKHTIEVIVDRLVMAEGVRPRLVDSLETALKWGEGRLVCLHQPPTVTPAKPRSRDTSGAESRPAATESWIETRHSTQLYSPTTGKTYEPPTAQHFSFNSPRGACPVCHGLGQKRVFDAALIVPDETRSLEDGAVHPYRRLGGKRMVSYYKGLLKGVAGHYQVPLDRPWKDLPADFRQRLLHGTGSDEVEFWFMHAGAPRKTKKVFEGVLPNLERLYAESESEFTRNRLKAYMTLAPCDACGGKRLRPELLAVTLPAGPEFLPATSPAISIPGINIAAFCALSIAQADDLLGGLPLTDLQRKIAADLVSEIRKRLQFLRHVGLDYLTLDRESGTLSGGEAQRIRLATQIGAGLMGVLYILDEPSIGLHQRDNERLLQTLRHLRDLGNSVLVVEHDEDTMLAADHLLDLGPGAGIHGGEIVAQGTPAEVAAVPHSLTGRYLRGDLRIEVPRQRVAPQEEKGWLEILGCRENNLRNIDVRIPLGTLTCLTGVSGSGKSTVVDDILRRALFRQWYGSKERPGAHREILGVELLEKCVVIDQAPIGRTPRSNPATYTGMFNEIRELFAQLPSSRVRGYDAGRFSFNVRGGRCEKCEGDGALQIEMHFLPPVYVTCDVCNGKRYNRETLEMTFKGLNIADVLNLTVDEAVTFFRAVPKLHDPCLTLAEVGLGYLKLGQPATTLSGGEAQRLKLAAELSRKHTGRTLYLLDEPTTGLHFHDIAKLLEVLNRLRAAGNTLVVIEHNLDVIKTADWVIDLGPEGGSGGGRIVAEGPPEVVAYTPGSHTGRFLQRLLKAQRRKP